MTEERLENISLTLNRTYEDFNKDFYEIYSDLTEFDCEDFNLLKVVLDGLKVNYASKGEVSDLFSKPYWYIRSVLAARKAKLSKAKVKQMEAELSKIKDSKFIVKGALEHSEAGEVASRRFQEILKNLNREEVSFVGRKKLKGQFNDFDVDQYQNELMYSTFDKEDAKLLKAVKERLAHICSKERLGPGDRKNIVYAMEKFYLQYKLWKRLLKDVKAEYFIFLCHYHFEGCLLELKRKEIKAIEWQHGLIAEEDIFYILPKKVEQIADRSLFADEIWAYGKYWKELLEKGGEYREEQIRTFGYYLHSPLKPDSKLQKILDVAGSRKIIIIATQTGSEREFIDYANWLKKDLEQKGLFEEYLIVLKPHPNEPLELYEEVLEENKLYLFNGSLDALFNVSEIIIAIYSTTLIEAHRFDLNCFSLFVDRYEDYINTFVESGFSYLLQPNENPVELMANIRGEKISSRDYFQEVDGNMLKEL